MRTRHLYRHIGFSMASVLSSIRSSRDRHFYYYAFAMRYLCVSIPRVLGFLSLKGGHGVFNVCNDLSACRERESRI